MTELTNMQLSTEDVVVKYLQSEGFLDNEYAYVGMQKFKLNEPPEGLSNAEDA